jgi:DNA-binding transcriptional regulator YdaS (Cro superfamily)
MISQGWPAMDHGTATSGRPLGMTVAALVLSIAAVLIAGLSAWYTRRQAVSSEGARRIEAARRHDELRPAIVGEYVEVSDTRDGQWPGVKITNQGPLDLDRVHVETVPAHRAQEAAIEGIYDHRSWQAASGHDTGGLRRGESWTFEVVPARHVVDGGHELDRGGVATFRCTCYATGHEPWVAIVSVEFPATPWIY